LFGSLHSTRRLSGDEITDVSVSEPWHAADRQRAAVAH